MICEAVCDFSGAMELRAAVGLQHGGRGYGVCGSERGGLSGWSSSVAPRLGNLSLLGDARLLGRRGVRGSVLVLRCSSEVGRGAGAERWGVHFSLALWL